MRPDINRYAQSSHVCMVFGLTVRSTIALPELETAAGAGADVDVTIEWGTVPERLKDGVDLEPWMQVADGRFQLNAPAGRYRVSEGRQIVIDPRAGASARDVRLYLLGTTLAALCHQRGLLPLHGAAVEIGAAAVAILGPSGTGKSTLAAQFQSRGRTVLADDLCVIAFDADQTPRVRPGLARIKLWKESLALTGLPAADLDQVGDGVDKFSLPITGLPARRAARLRRIYILGPDGPEAGTLDRLSGPEAVSAILGNIYRWPLAVAMGQSARAFDHALCLASKCEIFKIGAIHDAAAPWKLLETLERCDPT